MSRRTARLLMCRPDYYGIEYEINPWMDTQRGAHHALAVRQWAALLDLLQNLGAQIEFVPPAPGLPDMVFTANAGLVYRDLFVTARFRHVQRQGESGRFEEWFVEHGYRAACLVPEGDFEGAGDALFCGETLFAGYLRRSDIRAQNALANLLGCRVLGLELIDPRFYHLDTCFCPLAPGSALYHPGAFDDYGRLVLREHIANLLEVNEADAGRFACNAVVLGKDVVLNAGSAATERLLAEHGYAVHPTDLSEFLKAGGAAKCLTLRLDGEEAAAWAASP